MDDHSGIGSKTLITDNGYEHPSAYTDLRQRRIAEPFSSCRS